MHFFRFLPAQDGLPAASVVAGGASVVVASGAPPPPAARHSSFLSLYLQAGSALHFFRFLPAQVAAASVVVTTTPSSVAA